jgi:hypothetical protein
MPKLAVVRADPLIPVRDLLLFDEFYVMNLDAHLDRLDGKDLADALYLIDQGLVQSAPSTLGEIGVPTAKSLMLRPRPFQDSDGKFAAAATFDIAGTDLVLRAANWRSRSVTVDVDVGTVPIPASGARLVAAAISKKFDVGSYCTFMISDRHGETSFELPDTWDWSFTVRTPNNDRPSIAIRATSSGNGTRGVDLRLSWQRTNGGGQPNEADVFSVVLDALPVPVPDTPLEDVIGFRESQ